MYRILEGANGHALGNASATYLEILILQPRITLFLSFGFCEGPNKPEKKQNDKWKLVNEDGGRGKESYGLTGDVVVREAREDRPVPVLSRACVESPPQTLPEICWQHTVTGLTEMGSKWRCGSMCLGKRVLWHT